MAKDRLTMAFAVLVYLASLTPLILSAWYAPGP